MKKWNKLTIFLIPIGIAVNAVGGQLALALKLPVFLDCIGTFVTAALCGIGACGCRRDPADQRYYDADSACLYRDRHAVCCHFLLLCEVGNL